MSEYLDGIKNGNISSQLIKDALELVGSEFSLSEMRAALVTGLRKYIRQHEGRTMLSEIVKDYKNYAKRLEAGKAVEMYGVEIPAPEEEK